MNFAPIYLDWNATTPLDPAVREAMLPWLGAAEPARFGNASSRHEYGRRRVPPWTRRARRWRRRSGRTRPR
jgi:cysteine sulfinate desulfinase/cysteine desulfurase-like protein